MHRRADISFRRRSPRVYRAATAQDKRTIE